MLGAWAAALLSIVAVGRLVWVAFVKAVRAVIREELGRVWKDQDDIERRLTALELALEYVRQQVDALSEMMAAHIRED